MNKCNNFAELCREYAEHLGDSRTKMMSNVELEKVKVVEELIDIFGEKETLGSVLKQMLSVKKFKCPCCHGNGYTLEEYNAYPTNLPDSGFVYKPDYRKIKCTVCDGQGWTEKEMKPKYKQVLDGYEEV